MEMIGRKNVMVDVKINFKIFIFKMRFWNSGKKRVD